jgi:hypothetical protein
VTAVGRSAVTDAPGSLHGFPASLTSFVGRAASLGLHDLPAVAVADALARALARRQLLLVLDNCLEATPTLTLGAVTVGPHA